MRGWLSVIDQVAAGAGHVAHNLDRRLAGDAGIATADPGHALVATALLGLLHGRHRIRAGHRGAQGHAFGQLAPPQLTARHVSHPFRHRATSQPGADEIQSRLQHTIGQQVVQARVGALDQQCRQRGHGPRRALYHR